MGELESGRTEPEEFLQKMQQIFEKREEEFILRDQAYQEKERSLQAMLKKLMDDRERLKEHSEGLEKQKQELEARSEELREGQKELERQKKEQQRNRKDIEDREKSVIMKYNLELENVRNEEMRLKRLAGDYEYKLSLMDGGMEDALKMPAEGADPEKYMLRAEHGSILAEMEKKLEGMQSERVNFLRQILKLKTRLEETENQEKGGGTEEEAGEGKLPGINAKGKADADQETNEGGNPEVQEELTAEVLMKYIERNEEGFEGLSILHSEEGQQLQAERGRLQLRFLFTRPATFNIFAKRKNSARLRKLLEQFNAQYPGVQFRYEELEGGIYVTGFFTNDIRPYELMERVNEICGCFRQE